MPKKVIDFIKSQLNKAGANLEDEAIKTALAGLNAELELPDELLTPIDNGLLSIASAKNNHPEIKGHYFAQAYNGLDKELNDFVDAEKLPDEIKQLLQQEKSSTKRAVLLSAKIKELTAAKAGAGKTDKEELNKQIAELQGQLREIKEKEQGIHADYKKQLRDKDMGYSLRGLLGNYKTVYDEMDSETKSIILDAIIKKNLNAKNAEFTLDTNGNLVLQGKDGSNIFSDDHQIMSPKVFLDKVLAAEKALKVSDNQGQNNGQQNNNSGQKWQQNSGQNGQQNNNQNQNGNGGVKKNHVLASLANEALQSLEQSNGKGGF